MASTLPAPVCTDDFGNLVFVCRFGTGFVHADNCRIVGATIPGVHARYVAADTPESRAAEKLHARWFHETEANCNTCAHLERVQHAKSPHGFMLGRCARGMVEGVMTFHPDDPMLMPCYESRWPSA